MTVEYPYTLQWNAPFPEKKCPFPWGSGPPSNIWFPGPTQVLNPNGMLIGSAVFAEPCKTADRPTDSVGNNRPHLRTQNCKSAMRPNNNSNDDGKINSRFRQAQHITTRYRASTSTRWHCQLEGTPSIPPSHIRVRAVVWECDDRQTDTQTDNCNQYTFRLSYASREM